METTRIISRVLKVAGYQTKIPQPIALLYAYKN